MSLRYILVLLLVLAGLGAYVYFVDVPREQREERAKVLFDIDADDVRTVRVQREDESVEIERDGDGWKIVAPVAAKADKAAVESLVDAVADCKVEKDLGKQEADLDRFGLDKPQVSISLIASETPLTVNVGKTAPIGNSTYIQRVDDGSVLLTGAAFRTSTDKKIDDLRERRLFDFEDDDVRWFEIHHGDRTLRLERADSDTWKMVQPEGFEADEGAIRTYLSALRTLRVVSFIAEAPESLAPYKLDEAPLRVEFAIAGHEDAPRTVLLGDKKTETEFYAKVADEPAVYTVNDFAYRNLDKGARDLRDKSLLSIAPDDVLSVQVVRKNGDDFRLTHEGETWTVDGAEGSAKQSEIEQYIKDVTSLAGYEIVADEIEDPAKFGFDEPALQITVFGKDESALGSVVIGKTEGSDGMQNFPARNTNGTTVMLVRSYVFNRLDKDPETLVE